MYLKQWLLLIMKYAGIIFPQFQKDIFYIKTSTIDIKITKKYFLFLYWISKII